MSLRRAKRGRLGPDISSGEADGNRAFRNGVPLSGNVWAKPGNSVSKVPKPVGKGLSTRVSYRETKLLPLWVRLKEAGFSMLFINPLTVGWAKINIPWPKRNSLRNCIPQNAALAPKTFASMTCAD